MCAMVPSKACTARQIRLRRRLTRDYELVMQRRYEASGFAESVPAFPRLRRVMRSLETQFLSHYFGEIPRWRKHLRRLAPTRTLPDFCVIGPPKSATSDLAVTLLMHPNVVLPLAKEFPYVNPEQWRPFYPTEGQKRRHAARNGGALSPYLHPSLHSMEVPYSLSQVKPGARIVIVLRDPIKRLYSHWKWELLLAGKARAAKFPFLGRFDTYVDKSLERFGAGIMYSPCNAEGLMHSIYGASVQTWMECFGRDNVRVLDVRDYFANQTQFMERIYDFVGLPQVTEPKFSNRTNENPLALPPADARTVDRLRMFFAPHNEFLWNVIGEKFDW